MAAKDFMVVIRDEKPEVKWRSSFAIFPRTRILSYHRSGERAH